MHIFTTMIAILCADVNSNYFKCGGNIDIYTIQRSAFLFNGDYPVIAHPPCAQWSKLKYFSKYNKEHLDLAEFCVKKVLENGGILEHPEGSSLFKYFGLNRNNIRSIDQSWFGFPCKKTTYLYLNQVKLIPYPIFNLLPIKKVHQLNSTMRSRQTLDFCNYLINSIYESKKNNHNDPA